MVEGRSLAILGSNVAGRVAPVVLDLNVGVAPEEGFNHGEGATDGRPVECGLSGRVLLIDCTTLGNEEVRFLNSVVQSCPLQWIVSLTIGRVD